MDNSIGVYIEEVDAGKYSASLTLSTTDVFLGAPFNELNALKTDRIKYLLFKQNGKTLGGIIFGQSGAALSSPFSAPYGGILVQGNVSMTLIDKMARSLVSYCKENSLDCKITFPAPIINDDITVPNQLFCAALLSRGFHTCHNDLNFHIETNKNILSRNIKREYLKGLNQGYELITGSFENKFLAQVYEILEDNHKKQNYPMPMTLKGYEDTAAVANFLLFKVVKDEEILAGGIAYLTRPNLIQIISWGDRIETRPTVGPMSFMACELFDSIYHKFPEIEIIDLGPASSHGTPSPGLCDFKLKLGALPTVKQTIAFKCS